MLFMEEMGVLFMKTALYVRLEVKLFCFGLLKTL